MSISSPEIHITSASNKTYRELLSLLTGKGVKRHKKTLVSGAKVVSEIISHRQEIVLGWIAPPEDGSPPADLHTEIDRIYISRALFRNLDINGTNHPLLVVRVSALEPFREGMVTDDAVLFVPFQDPTNVGAVIRSAAAFDVTAVVLLREAANPYHPKCIRAAGTPLFEVRLFEGPSIYDLNGFSRPIVTLSMDGDDIQAASFPRKFILLPGLEGRGLPDNLKPDHSLSIPINPRVESLNAAVAASLALYVWRSSRI